MSADGAPRPHTVDVEAHGRYARRIVSPAPSRPAHVTVSAGAHAAVYSVLAATGAETGEPGASSWQAQGFSRAAGGVAGGFAWSATTGTLRSPVIGVPAAIDTVSVLFWTRYDGNPVGIGQRGEVHVSLDSGATWSLAGSVAGAAAAFYPERVVLTGLGGRALRLEMRAVSMLWRLDEIAVVAHGDVPVPSTAPTVLAVSANPVRGDDVVFTWPWPGSAGELLVYDFAGRVAWRAVVDAAQTSVRWPVVESGAHNGVYIAVARSGAALSRRRVFVARAAR
jgi:hypothetical protein